MSRKALAALAAGILPLIAACGQVAPLATPLPEAPAPVTAEATPTQAPAPTTAVASVAPAALSAPNATWTPKPTPKPTPQPTPTAKKATAAKTAAPVPTAADEACAATVVKYKTSNACSKRAQELLKKAGHYSPTPGNTFGVAAVNWTLVYQRSRGIADTGVIGPETWAALRSGKPAIPDVIPAACRTSGVVLCAGKAHHKLYWLKNGVVQKTIQVRFGGWNQDRAGNWRLHPTVNGTYRVYKKDASPCSERYGCGAMPYSTMFDPNMYFHYSSLFAKQGYSTSSHGCVNIKSLADAKWVMANTPIGAKVVVYSG